MSDLMAPALMTHRALRHQSARAVILTPWGSYLYVKHLPRRVKRIVKKGILHCGVRQQEAWYVDRYLRREGRRDQSHRFKLTKAKWGPGPWQHEPDWVEFQHAGLQCVLIRNMRVTGCLNGYVGVPTTHPWWGKAIGECVATPQCEPEAPADFAGMAAAGLPVPPVGSRLRAEMSAPQWSCEHTVGTMLEAHGGVNWASPSINSTKGKHRDLWWFAFDTGHAGDYSPMLEATMREVYAQQDPSGKKWAAHQRLSLCESYRELPYVRQQVEQLAEQIALAAQVKAP